MDYWLAFKKAEQATEAGNKMRQLDWNKAKELCDKNRGKTVYAGLQDDMEYTVGCIFDGEKCVRDYVNDDPSCTHPRWRIGQSGVIVYPPVDPNGFCAWAERDES